MKQNLLPEGPHYYETRAICFDAEAGYNMLLSPDVEFKGHEECESIQFSAIKGRCLGVFIDSSSGFVLAAYMATNEGVFLVKNPNEDENSLAGKTNAMRFDNANKPILYYHKNGKNWTYGREMKISSSQEPDDIDVLLIDETFPGFHYISSEEQVVDLSRIIVRLEEIGFTIPSEPTVHDIIYLVEGQGPHVFPSEDAYFEVLDALTQLYVSEAENI